MLLLVRTDKVVAGGGTLLLLTLIIGALVPVVDLLLAVPKACDTLVNVC